MDKEEILIRFKERIDSGKSIKYKILKEEDSKLLYAIERKIGSIFKCAKLIGLTEDDLVNKYGMTRQVNGRTLSEEEIRNRLLYLKSIGKLTTLAMRTEFEDLRLERSIKKLYGSVENGLAYFNLERDSRLVPLEKLILQINELHKNNADLSYSNMVKNHSKIIYTITNKMNLSWNEVLATLNIKYEPKKIIKYTREMIEDKLKTIHLNYGEINYSIIKKYESGLLSHIHRNYNNIYDFFVEYNYDPLKCMDSDTQKFKGYLFERCFKELIDKLDIGYEYNKYICDNTLRPDFILEDNVFLDCKLSSWTSTIESTIDKYLPHCEKLIIVFLRGEESHLSHIKNEKVIFKKIDYYINKLDEVSRQYFVNKFNYILNNEFIESVTTTRLTS